jgi:hypothetical protein
VFAHLPLLAGSNLQARHRIVQPYRLKVRRVIPKRRALSTKVAVGEDCQADPADLSWLGERSWRGQTDRHANDQSTRSPCTHRASWKRNAAASRAVPFWGSMIALTTPAPIYREAEFTTGAGPTPLDLRGRSAFS